MESAVFCPIRLMSIYGTISSFAKCNPGFQKRKAHLFPDISSDFLADIDKVFPAWRDDTRSH